MFEELYDILMSDVDYEALLEDIKPYISHHDFIIDAGCGSGYMLVELLKQGYTAIGLDLSSKMLSLAEHRLRSEGVMTKLYEHDLRNTFHAKADVIIGMFDVMNYFKGAKHVFHNCYQALYPKGRLIFDLYQDDVMRTYDGYHEDESDPVSYTWDINMKGSLLTHHVSYGGHEDIIKQYVYPLDYYVKALEQVGFKVDIKPSRDERKYLIIATK